jgi:hypothetical protein
MIMSSSLSQPESGTNPSWVQRNRVRIVAFATSLVAAAGVYAMSGVGSGDESFKTPLPVEAKFTNPNPIVANGASNQTDFDQLMEADYEFDGGYAAGVMPPTVASRTNFDGQYANDQGLPADDPPKLREVFFMRDRRAFSQEEAKSPTSYPLTVYNATDQPVDTPFIRYSATAIRAWQAAMGDGGRLNLNGVLQTRVRPITTDHIMIQTDQMPSSLGDKNSDGDTIKYSDETLSWIRPTAAAKEVDPSDVAALTFKNAGVFASRETIATEMCQSLVEVYNAKPLMGESYSAGAMEQWIALFNPPASHDLDLTAQESVCNGLGRIIAALYVGGFDGVGSVLASRGRGTGPVVRSFEHVNVFDYDTALAQLNTFSRIAEGVKQNPSVLETTTGHSTPTARHYYWSEY